MSAHTPGPWSQYAGDPLVIVNADGSSLGEASAGDPFIPFLQQLANAKLMAAAPTQHELLVEALDLVPRMRDDDPIAPALADWCRKVRAAIAEATS